MKSKLSLLAVAAAGTLAAAAYAQSTYIPPDLRTSTPGNGCTATGNAMRGGNLSASPTLKPCGPEPAPVAVMPVEPAVVAQPTPEPAPAPAPIAEAPAPAPQPEMVAQAPAPEPMPEPRADRN